MYPNPKTSKGQALCRMLDGLMVGSVVAYCLITPFQPASTETGGFLSLSVFSGLLILFFATFPFFALIMNALLCIKRWVCIKTNQPEKDKPYRTLNRLHIASLCASLIGAFFCTFLYVDVGMDILQPVGILACILCPLLIIPIWIAIFLIRRKQIQKRKAEGAQVNKPANYKSPVFLLTTILVVMLVACIPRHHERVSFVEDKNGYIYDRTNAFAYTYFKIENKSGDTVDTKLILFPSNFKGTREIFDIEPY